MQKRKIIRIDESKCNGCAQCMPNCPEGAIQIIDGKAHLVSDLFCDGLGACLGHCPQGAISVEERDAQEYDEHKVMGNIVTQGRNVIVAHLKHLKEHDQQKYLQEALQFLKDRKIDVRVKDQNSPAGHGHGAISSGCPGMKMMDFRTNEEKEEVPGLSASLTSQLRQWPVQLMLVPAHAPYLDNADVLIAADCVPFAYANFHEGLLKGKILLVGCPKLDDTAVYREKLQQMLRQHAISSITYAHMEVPCCFGLISVIKEAIALSGKEIPFKEITVSVRGELICGGSS